MLKDTQNLNYLFEMIDLIGEVESISMSDMSYSNFFAEKLEADFNERGMEIWLNKKGVSIKVDLKDATGIERYTNKDNNDVFSITTRSGFMILIKI